MIEVLNEILCSPLELVVNAESPSFCAVRSDESGGPYWHLLSFNETTFS